MHINPKTISNASAGFEPMASWLYNCGVHIGSRPIRGVYLTPVKDFLKMVISSLIQILGFEPMASWRYYCGVLTLGAGQFVVFILLPWKIFWKWSYLPSFKFWDSNPWPHGAITAVFLHWEQANSWFLSYSRERFSENDHIFRHSNFGIRTLGLMPLLLWCSYIGSRPIRGVYLTPVKDFLKMIISSVIQICISAVYIIFTIKWWCNG